MENMNLTDIQISLSLILATGQIMVCLSAKFSSSKEFIPFVVIFRPYNQMSTQTARNDIMRFNPKKSCGGYHFQCLYVAFVAHQRTGASIFPTQAQGTHLGTGITGDYIYTWLRNNLMVSELDRNNIHFTEHVRVLIFIFKYRWDVPLQHRTKQDLSTDNT